MPAILTNTETYNTKDDNKKEITIQPKLYKGIIFSRENVLL
jgi:hypothetical protein